MEFKSRMCFCLTVLSNRAACLSSKEWAVLPEFHVNNRDMFPAGK